MKQIKTLSVTMFEYNLQNERLFLSGIWKALLVLLVAQSCPTRWPPWTAAHQVSLSFTFSWSLLRLLSIELVMPSKPFRALLSLSSPAFNLCQPQGLFQWVGSLHQVARGGASASASVLPMNIQGWFPLGLTSLISLHSKGLSRVFSDITVQKHQFFGAQPSLWSNSYTHMWLLEKP